MENLQKKIQLLLNLYEAKNLSKAEDLNKELIRENPKIVNLYNVLGLILTQQKKVEEAINSYKEGIRIKPDYAIIYNNLGSAYQLKKNYSEAERNFKKSITLDANMAEAQNNLGKLYHELNENNEAINCYKKAIKINSKFFPSYYNLGIVYKNIGDFGKAKECLEESIKINKHFYSAHRILSQITKYKDKDKHKLILEELYENSQINSSGKAELSFALGKVYEDINNFSKAFYFYKFGNDLRRKEVPFSFKEEKNKFKEIKKIFNKNIFKKFKGSGNLDKSPIFILGMPRSGTTLVEQILSSHKLVFGGDELNYIPNLVKSNILDANNKISYKKINNLKNNDLKRMGQEYIDKVKNISKNSEKITDKLPINFKWVGLIKLILPNAKIIHCVRNPKDTCLSIYKNYFPNYDLNFAYNLNELTAYYKEYFYLMRYWKKNIKDFVIDIHYEDIVSNPEKNIRYLLKICKLNWDKKCLKFYENKRAIKTASDIQARGRIYISSINSWKKYKKYLDKDFKKLTNLYN